MFRSSSKSCQLVHRAFSRPATRVNSSTKRSTLNSFACSVETVRPDNFGFSHTSLRDSTRARACFERQTITSHHSFNLLPIYDTFPTKATPYRIGLRFMNSDSKNSSGDTIHNNTTSSTTTDPAHVSLPNIPREAMPGSPKASVASQTSSLRGLADSVDTTIQGVRSKVNPKDLLYYFALLATFGILVVGPLVARYV